MNLWFDFKYAWRLLFKTPGHSLLCSVVVALSVGLTMWSSALFYSQVWKPLPFPGSERWLSLQIVASAADRPLPSVDAYTYQELLERNRTVSHLGAFSTRAVVLSEGEASTSLRAATISPSLLAAMRTPPQLGRLFDPADGQADAAPMAILSFHSWQTYFASDPAIVGKVARIDGRPTRIVGVMPKGFDAFEDQALWLPLQLQNLAKPSDSTVTLSAFAVLREGQDAGALLAEMKPAVDAVNQRHPERFDAGRHLALVPANRHYTFNNFEVAAMVVFISVAVLLLGCVNVSLVLLARLLERSRELALRTALGSSRWRLMRQCLLESLFVVVLGLSIGFVLASLGVEWTHGIDDFGQQILATGGSSNLPELRAADFGVAVIAAAVLWLLSTLIPAWRVSKQDAAVVLAGSGKGMGGTGRTKTASSLVAVQVAVSFLLLVICANLVLAVDEETTKPTGMNTAQVMLSTYPTVFDARHSTTSERQIYWDELTAAIESRIPGAEIAYATATPTRAKSVPVSIEHREGVADRETFTLPLTAVSKDYFDLLGIALRSGRLFDDTDGDASLGVAVVDENTARRHWPDQEAIGKRIQLNPTEEGPWLTIVGVVSAVAGRPYGADVGVVYQPLRQAAPPAFQLLAKLPASATDDRSVLRAAAFAVDRDLPLHNLQMLDDYLDALNLGYTAVVPMFIAIAAMTAILAAAGLFGLISRSVARRTQEVGIRRALGGTQWQVTLVFLRQGASYLAVGIVGGGLGIVVTNLLSDSIPNILTHAAPVTLGVLVLMALVIFVASYLPTRRAVSLEPGDALRYE